MSQFYLSELTQTKCVCRHLAVKCKRHIYRTILLTIDVKGKPPATVVQTLLTSMFTPRLWCMVITCTQKTSQNKFQSAHRLKEKEWGFDFW